jgi:cobyrinic acid a,c-diamide synthase
MKRPRIIIAGTGSGCGKTTVALGIMRSLVQHGHAVSPFKTGPDYIDPMLHSVAAGVPSRNLDLWMLDETTVRSLFIRNSAVSDLSVIEGVMGLYDGLSGGDTTASTAHLAKVLQAPVVLCVDGEGMSTSIAALVNGFRDFDRDVPVRGIIINHIETSGYAALLKEIIEHYTGIPVLGYLRSENDIHLDSRHLGLIPAGEVSHLEDRLNHLAAMTGRTVDIPALLRLAESAPDLADPGCDDAALLSSGTPAALAVAQDEAFNFYYQDNLDLLHLLGAEIIPFSPLADDRLPRGIGGLYLGGGYPEVFAERLSQNTSMRASIRTAIDQGLPAYAECGGLMYTGKSIVMRGGMEFPMVGALPVRSRMMEHLQRFGYVETEATCDSILAVKGDLIRAHEFHYSETTADEPVTTCFTVRKANSTRSWEGAYCIRNLVAGYPHMHFWGNPRIARHFMEVCASFARLQGENS